MTDAHEPDHADGHGQAHDHGWREALAQLRHEAEHFYRDHFDWRGQEPPAGWAGPRFFPPAEDWRLDAVLDTTAPGTGEHVRLATSTGKLRDMTVAGELVFEAGGREHRLRAFWPHRHDGEPELFVPFQDATSGTDSYGAGRYLDLPPAEEGGLFDLDFNFAYNPSCAYSPAYDCPYPPPGNRLDVAVRAGEMVPFEQ